MSCEAEGIEASAITGRPKRLYQSLLAFYESGMILTDSKDVSYSRRL